LEPLACQKRTEKRKKRGEGESHGPLGPHEREMKESKQQKKRKGLEKRTRCALKLNEQPYK